jgi:hypothetical protein
MATTTPNYGWPVPTSTDLVKNGATAIEALGDAIDASLLDLKGGTTGQVLSKTTNTDMDFTWVTSDDANAIQNSIVDAKGDLIGATAADTPARLAVGTNGQVLTADSTAATGLKWSTSSGYNPDYQLINTGGTALTGASSVTVSGISGKTNLMVVVSGGSSTVGNAMIFMRFNADSGSNYAFLGMRMTPSTYFTGQTLSQTTIDLGYTGSSAADTVSAIAIIDGANATGFKPVVSSSVASGTNSQSMMQTAYYKGTSAITSVTIHADSGNLDAGTVFVYGA